MIVGYISMEYSYISQDYKINPKTTAIRHTRKSIRFDKPLIK